MKARYRVLITGSGLASEAVQILTKIGAQLVEMHGPVTVETICERLREAPTHAILLRGNPPINATVLAQAPELRLIAKHGVGVDSVDIEAATAAKVLIMVAGNANAPAVAEHTIALILSLARDLPMLNAASQSGRWLRGTYVGRELQGRTLGIVGFGRIGRRVAEIALALGLNVTVLSRNQADVDLPTVAATQSLETLLAQSDIVSLHVPLNASTRGLISRDAISQMRPGTILINTARGALVDQAALCDALYTGHLSGAALDTLIPEPPDAKDPILNAPNIIITPHIAAMTAESIQRMGVCAANNIAAVFLEGHIDRRDVVNRQILRGG